MSGDSAMGRGPPSDILKTVRLIEATFSILRSQASWAGLSPQRESILPKSFRAPIT